MICNPQIHDELIQMEESICPYCDQLLVEGDKAADLCCSEPEVDNNNGINVCRNCGSVHGYDYVNEYIDFYDNMYRIHRKSVYQRKYHIEYALNRICYGNRIELTLNQRDRIYKAFTEIGVILHSVNGTRKRMIANIMRRIFKMMGIPCKKIPITKSKKNIYLAFYDQYWASIMSLIGDKIKTIIE